jgi:hypothetical protein
MGYRVFYQLQREERVVESDAAVEMALADVYSGIFGHLSEDKDYFGMIDLTGQTLQFMYDQPSDRYWCEIPSPSEKGAYGKWLSFDQAADLLKALPATFSRETVPGLKFESWQKR